MTHVQSREDGKQQTWAQARKLARLAGTSAKPAQMYIAHEATQRDRNLIANWPERGRISAMLQTVVDDYKASGYNEKYGAKSKSYVYRTQKRRKPNNRKNKWRTVLGNMENESPGYSENFGNGSPKQDIEKELLLGLRELAKRYGGIPRVANALEVLNKVQVPK